MSWLKEDNRLSPIFLNINGQKLNLDSDIKAIVAYYENKPPDYFLLPVTKVGGKSAPECALDLKKNIYRIRNQDPKVELPEDLMWSESPFNDRNWEFRFHSWRFADCLIQGFIATGDGWYLNRVKWLVDDWWQDNFRTGPPSKDFSWYDHTIPLRLGALIRIWEFVRRNEGLDEDFVKTSLRLAYWHARILDEEASIRMVRHNHGLDQADYLMRTSFIFPELELSGRWQQVARNRMQDEIEFMMSSEGIQKENSPGYHISYGASVFRRLEWVDHYTNEPLSPTLAKFENKALEFATVIAQPDGKLPQLGDTGPNLKLKISLPNLDELSWFPHYEYIASKGQRGFPPEQLRFIFPESGYYIYRDKWDEQGENKATQLIFKCGFLAEGHRQDDDGQILLYGLGEPWLTDGGQYGYVTDEIREYMRSPLAHNVSLPENAKTQRNLQARLSRFVDSWGMTTNDPQTLSAVSCSSHMYAGYLYNRKIDIIAPRKFLITDLLTPNHKEIKTDFVTQFRVPDEYTVEIDEAAGEIKVISPSGNRMLIRFPKDKVDRVKVYSGQSKGFISLDTVGWREVEPVKTLRMYWSESSYLSSLNYELELVPIQH